LFLKPDIVSNMRSKKNVTQVSVELKNSVLNKIGKIAKREDRSRKAQLERIITKAATKEGK